MAQGPVQTDPIALQHPVEACINQAMQPTRIGECLLAQQPSAHHRRQGQRHHHRYQNRQRQRGAEFLNQSPHHATHQHDRQKYRHQGQGHRDDSEADFARTIERSLKRGTAAFQMTHDVFQHHDHIVHYETSRDSDGHEREIVDGVTHQIKRTEGANQRHGQRHCRHQRGTRIAQKQQHHQQHENCGDDDGYLNLMQ